MSDSIDPFDAMYTQRAIREFKPDRVPDELLHRLIEAATKAPSGANRQRWRFLVIKDADLKRRIGEYYQESWRVAYGDQLDPPAGISRRAWEGAHFLGGNMHETPVLILACIEHAGHDDPWFVYLPGGSEPSAGGARSRARQRHDYAPW